MIALITGQLIQKKSPEIVVDVNGVGYEILIPMTTSYQIGLVGAKVTLHCHLVVREDAQQLFGFFQIQDRDLFRMLIKANGVGPKMALAILSTFESEEFVKCVHANDVTGIVSVPGVGKKTAERLLIEMRDRLKDWQVDHLSTPMEQFVDDKEKHQASIVMNDAQSALIALGYKPAQASKAVQTVYKDNMSVDELIRHSLKQI
ncbi:Holliday junction branch migration protein RuvA [Marinicellulosiphila megalodicopiae]|uniref:Holliday junction branch migration protein RuvA n=1 Tax=Marinicellulosiphila megalodicopiae TaxID=2724896 RepID=UPI003BB0B365